MVCGGAHVGLVGCQGKWVSYWFSRGSHGHGHASLPVHIGREALTKIETSFKAAWCSAWELEALPEIFGEVDVKADTLVEMAEGIIAASKA